ncbi:hybrid sensor histidine kinase/response regulator [Hydrogenophaga sp. 2FB]|uniref:ATP-binding response regulator n=1 Tax=Hydrogenophaga sp. 2FB TaxID=2502187 RepID=UPI0010F5A2B8|nr:hybrid sensor histidine kinase/response regulator [Hydrogenophaga sp. 2FB]
MPVSALGGALGACGFLVVAHALIPTGQWMLWGALMVGQALARLGLWLAYRRTHRSASHEVGDWAWYAALGSAAGGVIWGTGAWLVIPPNDVEYQLVFVLLTSTLGSISIVASASLLRAFYAFTLPACIPVGIWMVLHEAPMMRGLGWVGLASLPLLSAYAHQLHRSMARSLRLHVENTDLLREVMVRKEQAEAENRKKSLFLAAASHDLRQPLHAMALQAHVLEGTPLSTEQKPMVGSLRASIDALAGLFNALLDMSRLDAGLVEVREAPLSLRALFLQIEREHRASAEAKKLKLRLNTGDWAVHSDHQLLVLLLGNLVSNAIRYTDHGGVLVSARRRGERVLIEVWDTGQGMSPAHQREVFKPFYQVGEVQPHRSHGLGLGLAIVHRLAHRLGLQVALRSEPGRGSHFSVSLPTTTVQPPKPGLGVNARPLEPARFNGAHVMVVDGEADIRAVMETLLTDWGCSVSTAATPEQALSKAAEMARAPQLLISNHRLSPQVTGLQLIERLRDEFNADLPALVVTGDTSADVVRAVQQAECDLLYKPVDPGALRRSIHGLLDQHRLTCRLPE